MSKLKKGDIVEIVSGSRYEKQGTLKGVKMKGEIIFVRKGEFPYEVIWSNGTSNVYGDKDLQLTESKKDFKVGDIIIGNSKNTYSYTKKGVECEVIEKKVGNLIRVKIVGSEETYTVGCPYFDLVSSPSETDIFLDTKVWIGGDEVASEKLQKEAFRQGWKWAEGEVDIIHEPINFLKFINENGIKRIYKGHMGDTDLEGFIECPLKTMNPTELKKIVGKVDKKEPELKTDTTYESLVREAISRYVEGSKLSNSNLGYNCDFTLHKHEYVLDVTGDLVLRNSKYGGNNYTVYKNGVWAEVIELPKLGLKIGDYVMIKEKSPFVHQGKGRDGDFLKGEVIKIISRGDYPYKVLWSTGRDAFYREEDLEIYNPDSTEVAEKLRVPEYPVTEKEAWLSEEDTKEEESDVVYSTDFVKPKIKVKKQIVGLEFQHPVIVKKRKTGTKKLITV